VLTSTVTRPGRERPESVGDVRLREGGTPPRSGPCEPRAAHGFFGLDEAVVAAIARWITGGP
jgi:hypothetical protein